LPSDFINYVETYYSHSDRTTEGASRPYAVVEGQNVLPNVDRLFLERVWQWLIRNSEIQLGDHVGHQTLTLSEAEVRNAVFKQANKPSAALPHSTDGATVALAEGLDTPVITQSTERNQLSEVAVTANPVVLSGAATNTTTEPSAQSHADIEVPETVVEAASLETSSIVQARSSSDQHGQGDQPASNRHDKPEPVSGISDSASIIRLYTSENRMWHALAGHNPDLNKIKALDFALLSMIAARGPKGIHQHELVKLSGQDKRSLPARTDRLHDDGYIKKQRVSVQQFNPKRLLNTSHLMLKRFVKDSVSQSKQVSTATTPANRAIDVRDEDHSEQGAAQRGLAAIDQIEPASQNGCTPRLIPQWTPDRNLSNQIFNLVALSGIQGMTMRVSPKIQISRLRTEIPADHMHRTFGRTYLVNMFGSP